MSEVIFYVNAADKRAHACRLLRKAYLQGARVLVMARGAQEADALDAALWTLGGHEFIPHGKLTDAPALQAHSPILIGHDWPAAITMPRDTVLLNLSEAFLPGFEQFLRVIELVSQDLPDRERARERWKQYRSVGVEPVHHDLSAG